MPIGITFAAGDLDYVAKLNAMIAAIDAATISGTFVTMAVTSGDTAAAPGYTRSGDSNTGVFFPGADICGISTGGTERARVTAGGFFKASNDGTYNASTGNAHEFRNNAGDWTAYVSNKHATNPFGVIVSYTVATPNGPANEFFYGSDASALRVSLRSNGGVANFSANDVNLSTRAVKDGCRTYTEAELLKYEAMLEAVDFGVWKYKDQTHDDWNHGPTVEGVAAALRANGLHTEEGSLIGVFDLGPDGEERLGLHTEDFKNIAIASLVASAKRIRAALTNAGIEI